MGYPPISACEQEKIVMVKNWLGRKRPPLHGKFN